MKKVGQSEFFKTTEGPVMMRMSKGKLEMFREIKGGAGGRKIKPVTLAEGVGPLKPGYGPRGTCRALQSRDGWKTRVPDILDADLRHCNWNASVTRVLRGPYRGRLWASWGQIDRNHAVTVHVKYSHDDGRVWIPWGRGAELPGGSRGWWDDTYMFPVTAITSCGDHVAVFWQHIGSRDVLWSRYDGEAWSKPETVPDLPVGLNVALQGDLGGYRGREGALPCSDGSADSAALGRPGLAAGVSER